MPLALRQSDIVSPDEWLRVDEAAALTNDSVRTWQWRAASEARAAQTASRRPLARKGAPEAREGKEVWYVHRSLDARLSRCPAPTDRETRQRAALLIEHPLHKVEAAERRAHWLRQWRRACDTRRDPAVSEADLAERIIADARAVDGEDYPISFRTLQLWRKSYYATGRDGTIRGVAGLIDRRGAEVIPHGVHVGRSGEAVDYFYSVYHVQSGPSIRTCHEVTLRTARREGWAWPPSYSATRKWLQTHDDLSLTMLMREGREAWQHRYLPHLEIDYTLIDPGDLYVCDHTQCDFWVEHDGEQLRPWLTAIQDARSRCIVGWHLGIAAHQDSILCAMRRAFRDWAIPRHMRIDNGRDFTSKLLTGMTKHTRDRLRAELGAEWREVVKHSEGLVECVDPRFGGILHELGVELIYAIPYSPWSKGTMERWFGTFESQCGKTFATYCGNSTLHRPECLEAIRCGYTKEQKRHLRRRWGRAWKKVAALKVVDRSAVPTLDEARKAVGEWIEVHHRTEHRGEGLDGASPLATWNTANTVRRADPESLTRVLESRGVYKVGANGVAFKVGSATMTYGANEPKLDPLRGRDVFITLDPDDVSYCVAWTPDKENRRMIARLECNDRVSPLATVDDLRTANASVNRRRKMFRQADRQAASRTRNAAAELRANQRAKLAELRGTGTDGRPQVVNVEAVRTGFEGTSKPVHRPAVDRPARDLSDVANALRFGRPTTPTETDEPRLTFADLSSRSLFASTSPTDADDAMEGTEADSPPRDVFADLGRNRNERATP